MTEPASGSVAFITLTTAGISILGIATGLHPTFLVVGFFGGLWAISYNPPAGVIARVIFLAMSSIVSAYVSPVVAAVAAGAAAGMLTWWPKEITREFLSFPVSFLVGFLALRWLGPALLRQAEKAENRT